MDNRPAKTRITAEELLSELAEAYRPRTRESLRKDGWISKLDLIDAGCGETCVQGRGGAKQDTFLPSESKD